MDLGEVGWGEVDWIGLAPDRNRWRLVVYRVVLNIFTYLIGINFSANILTSPVGLKFGAKMLTSPAGISFGDNIGIFVLGRNFYFSIRRSG
jgi:hypothetical protein